MVGILLSFWDGLFSGAMLVSGSVVVLVSDSGAVVQSAVDCRLHILFSPVSCAFHARRFLLLDWPAHCVAIRIPTRSWPRRPLNLPTRNGNPG